MHSDLNDLVPLSVVQAVSDRSDAPLNVLEGLGHACFIEAPQTVAAALLELLGKGREP